VPALTEAFPNHPDHGDPRAVRHDVEDRIQRIHFLRNRIAHHEPIHQRDLTRDHESILEVTGWISADTKNWLASRSRTLDVIDRRLGGFAASGYSKEDDQADRAYGSDPAHGGAHDEHDGGSDA